MQDSKGFVLVVTMVAFLTIAVGGHAMAQQRPAYKWDIPQDELAIFTKLQYEANAISVSFDRGYCGPIVIKVKNAAGEEEPKVTGLEVLGEGKIIVTHEDEVLLEEDIYGAMFRFHPDDYEAFVSMEESEAFDSPGLRKLLLHMCYGSFRRFWHRGMDAFIPDPMAGAAYVYSKTHGGVMVYQSDKGLSAYCMDTKKELFKRK